jgi:exopolyphosphatase/guanosine-5'-triphosphate,3'-diphosphate pyrophosphatase
MDIAGRWRSGRLPFLGYLFRQPFHPHRITTSTLRETMQNPNPISPQQQDQLLAVENLIDMLKVEPKHTHQVACLSLALFDQLYELHQLHEDERFWLQCAALLHDVGWSEGYAGHHKVTLRIILETTLLPFDQKERLLIGSIARYHRKSLPSLKHDNYATLENSERKVVDKLAALLRLGDALDSTHRGRIQEIACKVKSDKVIIHCTTQVPALLEKAAILKKSDLFRQVFGRSVSLKWT